MRPKSKETNSTDLTANADTKTRKIEDNAGSTEIKIDADITKIRDDATSTKKDDASGAKIQAETTTIGVDPAITNIEAEEIRKRFDDYFKRRAYVGFAALGRDQLEASAALLNSLESEVIRLEGPRVKNTYVTDLGWAALPFFLGFGALYCFIRLFGGPETSDAPIIVRFREFFILLAGCSVGTWLSYRIRNQKFITINDLVQLESDQLSPRNRVLFALGLATIIGLIFQSQLVTIAINQFTSNFQNDGVRALLIGMFCGVSEIALGDVVGRRASDFITQAAPEPQRP